MWYNSIRKVGGSMRLIQKFETQTTRGMLSKAWVELDDGTQCLIKGNSMENKIAGQEPFSEVIISRIGKVLGLPVLRYELIERSRCEDLVTLHGGYKIRFDMSILYTRYGNKKHFVLSVLSSNWSDANRPVSIISTLRLKYEISC